ncbi:hypothetical protein [Bacillus sp. P14.5]|uniref:DUF6843 domain-containing protein n=1 Tax=Bacillus sp. P14.5 TaxID=1983400 RepID=UPI000DEBDB41|nr:hypothetical protein [Bacillus sp. P14.5]
MTSKLKPALYSSLILSAGVFVLGLIDGAFLLSFIVLFYALAGNFLYGIPVSLLSEFFTKKLDKGRFFAAAAIHILFGFVTVFVIEGLAAFAVVSAVLFFVVDEWRKSRGQGIQSKRAVFVKAVSVLVLASMAVGGLPIYEEMTKEETNFTYLIPDGFEGSVVVFHNVSGQPQLDDEGDYSVVPVEVETLPSLEGTDLEKYGLAQTSTENRGGLVTDRYYYVDDDGNRTKINSYCIHHGSGGAFSEDGGEEIQFNAFQITTSQCGEDFLLHGSDLYGTQSREVMNYWRGFNEGRETP